MDRLLLEQGGLLVLEQRAPTGTMHLLLEQQSTAPTAFIPAPWYSPTGLWAVCVEGPREEPLTLAEAKLYAGLDWLPGDPRDALLEDFIRAARAQVEHDTGLALLTQTWDVTIAAGYGPIVPLPSQTQPTQSIGVPGALLTTTSWRYRPGVAAQIGGVPAEGATYRVVAGWPSAAALRREAPALHHAVALLTAHYATAGRDLVGETARAPMTLGYAEAIAPHTLIWIM